MSQNRKPGKTMTSSMRNCFALLLAICLCAMTFPVAWAEGQAGQQRQIVRVGFFAMDGYHMMDEQGNKSGYGYDVLRMMARYADVEYDYVGYDKSWSDMQQMLEDGDIDMVTSARKVPKREEKFDFSRPIGSSACMIAVRGDDNAIVAQDYGTYNNMRVGLLNGNTRNDDFAEFAEEKGFSYHPFYFEQVSDMEAALQSGEVDAIVSSSLRATEDERVLETFAGEEIYAIVKKGNAELLDTINYAIDQMNNAEGDWKTKLYNRYFTTLGEKNLEFTDKERGLIGQLSSADQPLRPERTIADIASGYVSYKASDVNLKLFLQTHPDVTAVINAALLLFLVLLAVLFTTIRRKNRKLKTTLEEQRSERRILDKMCMDFTAVYYVELFSGAFEVFHINTGTNTEEMGVRQYTHFRDFAEQYAARYLSEEDGRDFLMWISAGNLIWRLSQNERITFHYRSKPNPMQHEYFEIQAIKIYRDENRFYVLFGFRHIDEIKEKERAVQDQLKRALDEAQLSNEIISAIAKNFFSIYRINVQQDYFEEISNDDETHHLTGNNGCASEKLFRICDTMVDPQHRPMVRPFLDISTLNERLKNEEFISAEYKMCDGSWHRIRFIVKKRDDSGNVTHVLCVVRSISDSKRREESLHYEAEVAKREADMKTRFLATMSHDIRTPLNGLIGMLDLADRHADDLHIRQGIRAKARESLQYLVSLVNDVLDMNKLQSGELRNEELSFDLMEVIREIDSIYKRRAAEKQIAYETMRGKERIGQPFLTGNPIYLGRILSNIMDNAIKFSAPGTTISVYAQEEKLDDQRVLLTFVCQDQGCGMSEEVAKHAFDMFSQGNQSSRTKYEGSGLGLAIAKQLADRMGGSIELESKLGCGTTAIVKLPFEISTQEAAGAIADDDECEECDSVEGLHAMVVEDNELNREITTCMLEESGLEVSCAADGREAVELFEQSAQGYFDVIYMDIMMPRMNGLEAAKTIRAMRRADASSIPIIATSANAFAEDIISSRLAGMNDHLAKPLDAGKVIAALKTCLSERRSIKLRDDL